MTQKGFTIFEIMIVISLITILTVASFSVFSKFQSSVADIGMHEIGFAISSASNKARSGVDGTPWGIYFFYDEQDRTTNSAIIFSGDNFSSRNTAKDIEVKINNSIKFVRVNLSGNATSTGNDHEVSFALYSSETQNYGSLDLESYGATTTIVVSPNGFVNFE